MRVGKVRGIELDGNQVRVEFQVDEDAEFGAETGAAIRVKTLLGAMFLALSPAGSGQLEEEGEIPVERTDSPYDVVEVFEGLAERSERIDTDQLADALDTMADADPQHPGGVPGGARRASRRCRPTSPRGTPS